MSEKPKNKIHNKGSDYKDYKPEIETSLFISGRIMSIEELARVCKTGNLSKIRSAVEELQREYKERNSGIEIYIIKNSCGMRPKQEIEDKIMYLAPEGDMPHSMVKTLALIAYKQPVNQSAVARSRGGGVYDHIHKLVEMDLVSSKKHGRTHILSTTPNFNKYFQVEDLSGLVKGEVLKPVEAKKGKSKGKAGKGEAFNWETVAGGDAAGESAKSGHVPGEAVAGGDAAGEAVKGEHVPGEAVKNEDVPGESAKSEPVADESVKSGAVPGESVKSE